MENRLELYQINFDFIKTEAFKSAYLLYHIETSDLLLKQILLDLDIPATTYAHAKRNGLITNKKITAKLEAYFGISTEIDEKLLVLLTKLNQSAITESFYAEGGLAEVRNEIAKLDSNQTKNTPLFVVYGLLYLNAIDVKKENEKDDLLNQKIIPMLDYLHRYMPKDVIYYYACSYGEHLMILDLTGKYADAIDLIQKYHTNAPSELKSIGSYDLFQLYYTTGNQAKALYYLKEAENLYFKYFNVIRLKAIKNNLIALAFFDKQYDYVVEKAKAELLGISRDKSRDSIFFKATTSTLIASLIITDRYDEALKYADILEQHNSSDYKPQVFLFKQYIYLKTNQKDKLKVNNQTLKKLDEQQLITDDIRTLLDLMHIVLSKEKSGLKTFAKRIKPIKENSLNYLGRVVSLLLIDYEVYLKEQGKYLDLLDM